MIPTKNNKNHTNIDIIKQNSVMTQMESCDPEWSTKCNATLGKAEAKYLSICYLQPVAPDEQSNNTIIYM